VRHPRLVKSVILLLLCIGLALEPVRYSILTVVRLPFTILTRVITSLILLPRLPKVIDERNDLKVKVLLQEVELARLREKLRKHEQAAVLRGANSIKQGTIATIIDRSRIPTQRSVLINKGSQDKIVLSSIIMDVRGVLGRVLEVFPGTSLVLLLTDPESQVAAMVERSRETGLLIGLARKACKLIYLDEDADIEVGDQIITAGLGGPYLTGLPLGTVVSIVRDQNRGTASAIVALAANPSRVESVLCIPPAK